MSSTRTNSNQKRKARPKFPLRKPKFEERLIEMSRVSKVTKGGKKLSFRAVMAVGDERGRVGIGIGKADEVANAFKKAKTEGQKNLIRLPLTKSSSIPHRVMGRFGACQIVMRPSMTGSGVVAGGAARIILEVAGVKNVIAKQLGSKNSLNNARAAISALERLTTKSQVEQKRTLSNERNGKTDAS